MHQLVRVLWMLVTLMLQLQVLVCSGEVILFMAFAGIKVDS